MLQNGTTINGQATITGLVSTGKLAPGMAVAPTIASANVNTPLFPPQTYVTAINSTTAVTVSGNASASGVANLIFGCDVYEDEQGYAGSGSNAYQSPTQLYYGQDYCFWKPKSTAVIMPYQGAPITCGTGYLARIRGVFWKPWTNSGGLAPFAGIGSGNVLVNYTAGYETVPGGIQQACLEAVAKIRASRPLGYPLKSEHYEEYGYDAELPKDLNLGWLSGTSAATLLRYKNLAV
jgi:hypothetical protein